MTQTEQLYSINVDITVTFWTDVRTSEILNNDQIAQRNELEIRSQGHKIIGSCQGYNGVLKVKH